MILTALKDFNDAFAKAGVYTGGRVSIPGFSFVWRKKILMGEIQVALPAQLLFTAISIRTLKTGA